MIEIVASIRKMDIATCGGMKGSVNLRKVTVGGREFDAGKLWYVGFAGGLDATSGLYVGHNRFTEVRRKDLLGDPKTDFEMIPGGLTGEVDDGLHARDGGPGDGFGSDG
jgi:hypothetical protein